MAAKNWMTALSTGMVNSPAITWQLNNVSKAIIKNFERITLKLIMLVSKNIS